MNIMDNNVNVLNYLATNFPNSVSELSLDGNYLVYQGEKIDISNFDLQLFFMSIPNFDTENSFYDLNSEDIFKIVRLHIMFNDSLQLDNKGKKDNQEEVSKLQKEVSLFDHVNIVKTKEGSSEIEYIVIDGDDGVSHVFKNDSNVDIFDVFFDLQALDPNAEITTYDLIHELNHKLKEIDMDNARDLLDRNTTTEDFENKLKRVNDPYLDDPSIRVYGNQEEDIALVTDSMDSTKKDIKTFDENERGDLIIETHNSNPNVSDNETNIDEDTSYDIEKKENDGEKVIIRLIPLEDFYRLYDSSNKDDFNHEERIDVDLYYAFFGDLILYEDYLLPELRQVLGEFRRFTEKLELNETDDKPLTFRQNEIVQKRTELEVKKTEMNNSLDQKRSEEYVKTLKLRMENKEPDNTGSISVLAVIGIIVACAVLLTLITMYLIG